MRTVSDELKNSLESLRLYFSGAMFSERDVLTAVFYRLKEPKLFPGAAEMQPAQAGGWYVLGGAELLTLLLASATYKILT